VKIVLFVHSLISDWNHGNVHFLRGVVAELQSRGHDVRVYEPSGGWSLANLVREGGQRAIGDFHGAFPLLQSSFYEPTTADLDEMLDGADLVLVHEWNEPELVQRVGEHRSRHDYALLFHDTHHRAVTQPEKMAHFDLQHYDGVLAFGRVIRDIYLASGSAQRAWTWHEAADTRVFKPTDRALEQDLVWIGNWGDGERTQELEEFLLEPVAALGLSGTIHGVRYPADAVRKIGDAGLRFGGWIANHNVPDVFGRHRVTVHVPRRPYALRMTGVPTIRMFEALASGIPLVSAPWEDSEGLFRPGTDYLIARDGAEMTMHLKELVNTPERGAELARNGLETIRSRHTCAHRVDELMSIYEDVR